MGSAPPGQLGTGPPGQWDRPQRLDRWGQDHLWTGGDRTTLTGDRPPLDRWGDHPLDKSVIALPWTGGGMNPPRGESLPHQTPRRDFQILASPSGLLGSRCLVCRMWVLNWLNRTESLAAGSVPLPSPIKWSCGVLGWFLRLGSGATKLAGGARGSSLWSEGREGLNRSQGDGGCGAGTSLISASLMECTA